MKTGVQTKNSVNQCAYNIVGCAIEVQRFMGPGLLESIYEECLAFELRQVGFDIKRQFSIPVFYKEKLLKKNFVVDLIVNDLIIVELKTVTEILPIHKAQLLTYMKLTQKPKGLIINFNTKNLVDHGLVPLVNNIFEQLPN